MAYAIDERGKKKRKFHGRRSLKSTLRMNKTQIKMHIERLTKDNQVLKERIAVIESTVPRTSAIGKKIADLSDQETSLNRKQQASLGRQMMLGNLLKTVDNKIFQEKRETGGVNHNASERRRIHNQIKVLENRLDRMLSQYNQSIAENRKLREHIETLKEERVVFDGIYRKMEKELEMKKLDMAQKIEESNNAFEDREGSKKELDKVKQQRQRILMDYQEKSAKLDDIIVQNKVVQEFLKVDRIPQLELSIASDDSMSDSMSGGYASHAMSRNSSLQDIRNSPAMSGRMVKSNLRGLLARKRKDGMMAKLRQKRVENENLDLVSVFKVLEEELELKPDDLIQSIQETEENNFSLYQHSAELSGDVQVLDDEITTLRSEIESYVSGKKSNEERKRNRVFQNLQQTIQDCEEKSKMFENRKLATGDVFEQIMGPLKDLFVLVGCNADIIVQQRGDFDINEGNMMTFLSYIEQKIDTLIRSYRIKKKLKVSVGPKTPKNTKMKRKKMKIKPPSSTIIEEGASEGSKYEQPMTREELIRKYGN